MPISAKAFEPDAACPLDGVRVVDMSRLVAGNAVTSQLADFGAEVIKIEDPGKGDPLRAWQTNGVSVHWKLYSRNKKSVALSPRDKRGLSLLRDLIVGADVLVENFRPGTLEKMGLAPAALHALNPRLVIVRVSGWGQDGPYKDRPGFGTLVESMSGYAARTCFAVSARTTGKLLSTRDTVAVDTPAWLAISTIDMTVWQRKRRSSVAPRGTHDNMRCNCNSM